MLLYQKIIFLVVLFLIQLGWHVQYKHVKQLSSGPSELIERIVHHSLELILVLTVGGSLMCG